MNLFAIRDDDVSFWTSPDELEEVHSPLWEMGLKVSFAVIPFGVEPLRVEGVERFCDGTDPRPLGDNQRLVDYLRRRIAEGSVEIMLHGYDHRFKVGPRPGTPAQDFVTAEHGLATPEFVRQLIQKAKGRPLDWRGEYRWKPLQQLVRETLLGKEYLEKLLGCKIEVFVPPGNDIGPRGAQAVESAGLDMSAVHRLRSDRTMTKSSIAARLRAQSYRRLTHRDYPFPLSYGGHRELTFYTLSPEAEFADLRSLFDFCKDIGAPCVIATHYWELQSHPRLRTSLKRLAEYALENGARPATVSECLHSPGPRSPSWRLKRARYFSNKGIVPL